MHKPQFSITAPDSDSRPSGIPSIPHSAFRAPHFVGFANELSLNSDGWAQLAPFGDFPGRAVITNSDGSITTFDAVQRLDRAAADAMVRNFYSLANRVKRFFKSCNIYHGHPDMPDAGSRYPDGSPKGTIADLQVRDTGLFCRPFFNNEGEALLNGPRKLYFSGRWSSAELPAEQGRRIFRPDELKSAGLTTNPNLPVQHVNDRESNAATSPAIRPPQPTRNTQQDPTHQNSMNKQLLIQLLATHGVQFTNDTPDHQFLDAIGQLGAKAASADTLAQEKAVWSNEQRALNQTIATLTSQRDASRNEAAAVREQFANERKSRITSLLDDAITAGRITAAERHDWERRLECEASFANESAALARLPKSIKTASILDGAGQRKIEIANASQRSEALQMLVKLEMDRAHCDYHTAFARVREANPALFAEMKEPKLG